MFSKITNPYEELKKKKNYSSAFSNPYQKKPSVGISPMPQTTQKNQEVKKTETSTKKIPKLTPITETKKTSTTEVDPTILPTHKDFLKAETRRQLPKAFVSALKNIITPLTVVIPEEIKDPEEQIKYILNQRLYKLDDIGRGFIARCISLPAEIIALTSKEFEMPKEVRLPFTKTYYPTYSGIYDEAYQAGGSHALATLVTTGMLAGDGLIVSAGLSSLRPQPKGLVTQQQASISRRQDIKVKLTREDIQAITRGPEFAKVDPVKLEAFKTLTREGVNWTKILNATKKINPATGKPYTINEAYKFGLDNLKPGYIKPAEMAKELDIYKGATPQAKATGVSAGVSSSLVAEASKYESADEFIKAQPKLYHGGTEIKEVGNMRSKWGAFYMTDNPTYAKSYGGNKSFLNEMVITPEAKLADLRKPSSDIVKQIENIISPKKTGKTFKIQKPDGSFIEVPETKGGLSNPVHSSADIIQGIKDGKAYYAEMPEVKEALKKIGYDGMITQESKFGANYGVWNKDVIKTKSQLTDIWNEANKATPEQSLIQEAKKYKSAEEFIKAQGTPVYHGTPEKFDNFSLEQVGKSTDSGMFGKGIYFTDDLKEARTYSKRGDKVGEVKEVVLDLKKPYIIKTKADIPKIDVPMDTIEQMKVADKEYSRLFTEKLQKQGYDGVIDMMSPNQKQYVVFNPSQIKTKSQLINIWNEANKATSAEEFIEAKQKQADLLKQRFQETKSGNDLRAWKKLQNEIDDYQVDVAKKLDIKRIQEQRIKDNKIRKADATVDKLSKDDLDLLINEAKKVDNLDDFIGKIRGSATQYGEYTPKLRKYVRPESVFMGDIKGLNPNTKITVYRGIDSKSVTGKQIRNGDFVTTDYNDALQYTDSPSKVVSLRTRLKNLVAEYPDEVDISNPLKPVSYELIYNSTGKINKITKSKLIDIWNKAKGKAKEILKPKEGSIKPSEIGKSLSTDKAGVRASAQAVQAIKPILGGIKAIDPKSPFVEELTNEIAYRVNSKGDLVPAIRQQSGIYAPKEFENFPFKDVGGKDLNNINFAGALDNIVKGKGFGPMMKMMFEHNKLLADRNEFITITSSKISKLLKKYKMLDIFGKPKSKDGELVFQMMEGKYPKEAGPFHKKIADELRTELDSLREQANKVRRLVGKEEIGYIENYAPHIQKTSFWQDILKSKQTTISDNFDFVIPNRINASYFKKRFGLIKNKETNIFKLLDGYISAISNDIYVSPIIEQLKAVNSVFAGRGMMKANNWINTYIRENLVRKPNTIDNFAGLKAGSPVRKLVGRFIQARNLGALVGNIIWSIATQPASLGLTYMKTGRHMGSGMLKYFVDKNLRNRISDLPSMRIKSGTGIGTTLGGDIDRITSKIYKTKIDNWNDVMGLLGNVLEKYLTGISASAGYSKGIKLGLKGKELDIYADYVAQVTQSMYNAESRPLALNSMLVRLGAPFQTFAFEAWRHANTLGGRTKGIPLNKQQRFWGVMNLLVATFVINYLHKKIRGRKLQTVGSFIPFIGSWVDTQINKLTKDKTQAGRSPIAPLEDFNKMNEAIKSAIDDGDLTKLRKELVFWSLGMSGIGGAGQINRIIDGIIATEKGYVDNVKGERLYDIKGWDKLFAPIVGPYGTKAGMEYLDGFVKTSIETKEEMANRILKEIKDNNLPNDLAKKFLEGELKKREDAFERILLTIPEKDVFAQSLLEYIKNGDVSEKRAKSITKKYLETYTSEDAEADDERSKFAIYSLAKNEETAISQIVKYAQAIGTDPITAFDLLFKKEKIRKFKNGAIIVHRMDLKESEAFKKEMGATGKLGKEYKLDHTIPLQLGGDNTEGNLRLVTTDDWASFTPVENFLGKKLLDGEIGGTKVLGIRFKGKSKMSLKEAQQLLLDFKEGKITAQEIYDKF